MKLVITSLLLLASSISISCQLLDDTYGGVDVCLSEQNIEEADWVAFIKQGGQSSQDMYCVAHCVLKAHGVIDEDGNLLREDETSLSPENYAVFASCKDEPAETPCQKASNMVTCALKTEL